jgi:hypothetical protein
VMSRRWARVSTGTCPPVDTRPISSRRAKTRTGRRTRASAR